MSGLPQKAQDRVNTYGIVLIGLVSSVLLWVSVVALQAYYNRTAGDLESERNAEDKSDQLNRFKAAQLIELQDSKYVNPQKGIVTIPIDAAKGLVLRDLRDRAPSLVPAVGPHDQPTVPAVWGRPPDSAAPAAGGAGAAAGGAPAEGAAPAGGGAATAEGAAPAAGGAPAEGAAPAAGGGAATAEGGAALPPGTTPGNTPPPRDPNTPRTPSSEAAPAPGQPAAAPADSQRSAGGAPAQPGNQ